MCGRVVVALNQSSLAEISGTNETRNIKKFTQSYNIAPGRYLPVTYKAQNEKNLEFMKWGTVNKDQIPLSNARSENFDKFYSKWKRCIIIISGYYEWKKQTAKNDENIILSSQPYYIKKNESEFIKIAGIYKNSHEKVN